MQTDSPISEYMHEVWWRFHVLLKKMVVDQFSLKKDS